MHRRENHAWSVRIMGVGNYIVFDQNKQMILEKKCVCVHKIYICKTSLEKTYAN